MRITNLFEADFDRQPEPGSLADQIMKSAQATGLKPRLAGTPEQERERSAEILAKQAGERKASAVKTAQGEDIDALTAKLKELESRYKSLGGANWQYADREQNLTDREREARAMEPELNRLRQRLAQARKHQHIDEGRMGEIAAEYEDYKKLSPREFYNAYRMTKQQWMDKHRDIVSGQVEEQVQLPYAPRTEQLGRANFTLLQRAVQQPTGPRLSLSFGDRVVDLDRDDINALAEYYDEELTTKDARINFIRIVMSDADNLNDVLRRLGRRTSTTQPGLFQEAKKKDSEDLEPEVRDTALSRAITRAKADFPTAGSGIEALAKDFMRSQEQDQKSFDQLRAAERQQANLLNQINQLDQQQDNDIDDLEDQNITLARRLQQLQNVNSELEKKIAGMTGRRAKSADKPDTVVPGTTAGSPAVSAATPKPKKSKTKKAKAQIGAKKPDVAALPTPTASAALPQPAGPFDNILEPTVSQQRPALAQRGDAEDNGIIDVEPKAISSMASQLAQRAGSTTTSTASGDIDDNKISPEAEKEYADLLANIREPVKTTTENKRKPPKEVDYDDDYQRMVQRVGKLAKAGPMKTVWDPVKRVYKNVPVKNEPGRD
jgi:small-conductance mechanosensitive channel